MVVLVAALSRWGPGALTSMPHLSVRTPVVIGAGAAASLFAAQAGVVDAVADRVGPGALDESVWAWFVSRRSPTLTGLMTGVSTVGGTAGMVVLALAGAVLLWRARHRLEATIVLGATAGAGLLVKGFKNLYDRPRPPVAQRLAVETNASLPSGHALGSAVVLGVLVVVVVLLSRRAWVRGASILLGAVATATIGLSRLYMGVHWASDVVTGWLLGGAWLTLCVTALILLRYRDRATNPVPDTRGTGGGLDAGVAATGR